jgi:hypothetical protein
MESRGDGGRRGNRFHLCSRRGRCRQHADGVRRHYEFQQGERPRDKRGHECSRELWHWRHNSEDGILGVSGHVVNYSDNSHTVSDAQYLGISLWRDGISGNSSSTLSVYQGLYNIGISFIGLPWLPTDITFPGNVNGAKQILAFGPGALFAVEGPNEPSISTFRSEQC